MAQITASMVKELRERTGVGMMECKKALTTAGGDLDEAVKVLRKAGAAKAEKKAGRATGEGRIFSFLSDDGHVGSLVELSCETDFVARNEDFVALGLAFAAELAEAAPELPASGIGDGESLLDRVFAGQERTVAQRVQDAIGKLGENMQLRRFARFEAAGPLAQYIHAGDKIAVMVELGAEGEPSDTEEALRLGRDIAMHVAAANPRSVDRSGVDEKVMADEREIIRSRTLAEGKPEAVVDKIVEGRLSKFFQENCLIEQPFVKDPEQTVGKLLEGSSGRVGATLSVRRFARLAVGE